jgi:hypothetical protein
MFVEENIWHWGDLRDRTSTGYVTLRRRLDVEENICSRVFSVLFTAYHSSIAAEELAGRLAAQREPSAWVRASFAVERSESCNI